MAKASGAVAMRISMIRPMPFCPSLEPWAKETPVQVRISSPRIHQGGGVRPSGARNSAGLRTRKRSTHTSSAVPAKPTSGDSSSA
ncbi:hypothetical protein D3C76_1652860 [compost metagenome]